MKPEGADVAFARWQAAPLIAEGRWRSAAACRSADPEVFFPISSSGKSLEQIAKAKAICAGCPVGRECLAFALRTHQVHGIWGGATEEERAVALAARPGQPCSQHRPARLMPGDGPSGSVR
jgi:WhiB family transcriptional regulator, redox-sensing transcriptional regulator